MEGINLIFRKKKENRRLPSGTPYDKRYGFWGTVVELHPENNTVHVRSDTGIVIPFVRVASDTWVTVDTERGFLSGRRKLPPVDTYVFCAMPNGEYSSAFVQCSGFTDDPLHAEFKEKSVEAEYLEKNVENSGWTFIEDRRTGSRIIQNKPDNPTITIEADQEDTGNEKINITIHKTVFTVDPENGITIETDKNAAIAAEGNLSLQSSKEGTLDIGNSIDTLGNMIQELLQGLMKLHVEGGPVSQTGAAWAAETIAPILAKWPKVFI